MTRFGRRRAVPAETRAEVAPATPHWRLSGQVVLDLTRSEPTIVEQLEPHVDFARATGWGGYMDGTLELTDEGVVWVPSEYSRRYGFDAFRLPAAEVADIHVTARRGANGEGDVEIDLADHRTVSMRVPDVERWQTALDDVIGA